MDNIRVKQQSFSDWRDNFHPTEIESIDIIKNEPLVNEGKTTRYRGFDVGGSGHKDSLHRGTNEKIIHGATGVNYNLVKNKDKNLKILGANYADGGFPCSTYL